MFYLRLRSLFLLFLPSIFLYNIFAEILEDIRINRLCKTHHEAIFIYLFFLGNCFVDGIPDKVLHLLTLTSFKHNWYCKIFADSLGDW